MLELLTRTAAALIAASLSSVAFAHHSNAEWDPSVKQEFVGEVVNIVWRNPHVRLSVSVQDDSGAEAVWSLNATSVSHLIRQGVDGAPFEIGDTIRFVGSPSTRRPHNMNVDSVLISGDTEVLLRTADRHWPQAELLGNGKGDSWGQAENANAEPNGFFTVWRSVRGSGGQDPLLLTPEAEAIQATWNVEDNWVVRCQPRGMPSTMGGPYPREFIQEDDRIIFKNEEFDAVRVFHMSGDIDPETQPATPMGFSVGRWEGQHTLVVETSRVSFPWYSTTGIPQSEDVSMVERFTLSDDELRLTHEITVTDPATFTTPARRTSEWLAVPGIEVRPFESNCDFNPWIPAE
jgi:hypothetical protein